MRVRVKFAKTGIMRYVGHLDLMRFFQKAVKRSELPIRYSEGFNPHQIMSFAAPLGVGLTSEGEYMDIDLKEKVDSASALKALNDNMVEGLEITGFKYLPDTAEKCMSAVTAASYVVTYKDSKDDACYIDNIIDLKERFFDEAVSINIVKKTKKGERELDLKPLIYRFNLIIKEGVPEYDLLLSSGSTDNIKPELVIKAFHEFIGLPDFDELSLDIRRIDMFTGEPDSLISLGDIGDEH
ncbi:TIGR03936 family radical SAM-associated protein [Pseudobutyrivibrio xylanivorans]|uniref:Radical SAM-linked protein n=1 Tax=Pseudobutyrivibrio xylanivorans DSM 14809 TaxID=1123012 RepID=A0A1M6J4X2_PSEXY|nr:TIGR03936 family radical SAM-associated protein [Pseudobutyrivibrio xylanivorans]SHJ41748.1 radical SAM-linked protein [Pseudobutyrivibrio xylanivorans DSM 14809]